MMTKARVSRRFQLVPPPPSPCFSQVLILKVVKVLCFDTLLQVFILKGLTGVAFCIAGSKSEEYSIGRRIHPAKARRSGPRAQVAANRLGRQFHELRLHETGVLSIEIYSW